MFKIIALGGSEFTLGFRLAGIETVEISEEKKKEPQGYFEELFIDEGLGIIITDDKTMGALPEHFRADVEARVKPVTVMLSTAASQETLRKQIKKSIGVDLWKD